MYKSLIRPLLFTLDPESAHELAMSLGRSARYRVVQKALQALFAFEDPRLEVEVFGIKFSNPIGLAAGFDKECRALPLFSALGFGHIEAGTITAESQEGNPRPRIFRYSSDRALINRMGFPSLGAEAAFCNLGSLPPERFDSVLGINIGKTKAVPIEEAELDYLRSFERLKEFGKYFVLNVSSPNTPELRKLQEPERLLALFKKVAEANDGDKPILVKLAPDLTDQELKEALDVCMSAGVAGVIATNTTFSRDRLSVETEEIGGLSGAPLRERSLEVVAKIYSFTDGNLPIVGVGGVSDASHVVDLLRAGASLVQIYTGLIYEGPGLVRQIKKDLVQFLNENNLKSISEITPKNR